MMGVSLIRRAETQPFGPPGNQKHFRYYYRTVMIITMKNILRNVILKALQRVKHHDNRSFLQPYIYTIFLL